MTGKNNELVDFLKGLLSSDSIKKTLLKPSSSQVVAESFRKALTSLFPQLN
jgi:hypothetical protein